MINAVKKEQGHMIECGENEAALDGMSGAGLSVGGGASDRSFE